MAKTLFYGGHIITENDQDEIYQKGWVLVENDRIIGIGEGDPPEVDGEVERRNVQGHVVMPGFVNIHTHVGGTIFKALSENLENSFYGFCFPMERFLTPESMHAISMVGAMEAVKFGSTFINDMYHYPHSTAKAVGDLGMRGIISGKIYEPDFCRLQYNDYTPIPGQAEEKLGVNVDLIEKYHKTYDRRIECGFGPHATDTVSIPLAKRIRDLADHYGVRIHTHVSQKTQEVEHDLEAYGMRPVEYLLETGLAGPDLTAAHCVLLTDHDAELLQKHHIHVAHCAEVFLKTGMFADVKKWYDHDVYYALGTDWVTLNPWTNMRFYLAGWRTLGGIDRKYSNASQAMRRATIEAARFIGKGDELGSLEVGKKADLLVLDVRQPHLTPMYDDVIATLVFNATGNEVETVMIDGRIVVDNFKVQTVDEMSAMEEASEYCKFYLKKQLEAK